MKPGTYIHVLSLGATGRRGLAGLWRRLRARAFRIFSDEVLMRRARAGDPTAFDALVSRHRTRLRALGLDPLESEGLSGDVLSETVLTAFKNLDSLGEPCAPGTWLYLHGFRAVFRRVQAPEGEERSQGRAGTN